MIRVAWFLRAIEQRDHRWRGQHGRQVYDMHDELAEALQHLRSIARTLSPAELIIHRVDGGVEKLGPASLDETGP